MERRVAVLRLMAGTNTHGLTPWFINVRPSITVQTAVIVIWHYLEQSLALSLWKREKGSDAMMSDARPQNGVAPSIWYPYACHRTLVWRYWTLHHFRTSCFRIFAAFFRESPRVLPYCAQRAEIREWATERHVAVLRLMAGTNTRGMTPWFIDIRPSITFEPAVFVIWHYLEIPLALSLLKREKGSDVMMSDVRPKNSVAPSIWYPYACHRTLVRRYWTLHRFQTSCFCHSLGAHF